MLRPVVTTLLCKVADVAAGEAFAVVGVESVKINWDFLWMLQGNKEGELRLRLLRASPPSCSDLALRWHTRISVTKVSFRSMERELMSAGAALSLPVPLHLPIALTPRQQTTGTA